MDFLCDPFGIEWAKGISFRSVTFIHCSHIIGGQNGRPPKVANDRHFSIIPLQAKRQGRCLQPTQPYEYGAVVIALSDDPTTLPVCLNDLFELIVCLFFIFKVSTKSKTDPGFASRHLLDTVLG